MAHVDPEKAFVSGVARLDPKQARRGLAGLKEKRAKDWDLASWGDLFAAFEENKRALPKERREPALVELIKILAESGLDVCEVGSRVKALRFGKHKRHIILALSAPLKKVCEWGMLEGAKALLELGADPNRTTDRDDMGPLAVAANAGNWALMEILVKGGANPGEKAGGEIDKGGYARFKAQSVLELCCVKKKMDLAQKLLELDWGKHEELKEITMRNAVKNARARQGMFQFEAAAIADDVAGFLESNFERLYLGKTLEGAELPEKTGPARRM